MQNTTFTTVTFIWMQGESDRQFSEKYEANLLGLITQLKTDLKREDINIIIGRISDFGLKKPANSARKWEKIRQAQMKVAVTQDYGAWVDTDDLNGENDSLHYPKAGYKVLGERYAVTALELIKKRMSTQGVIK